MRLADIEDQGIETIFCLGDVIGYGPDPQACIDAVMNFDLCILGNHDQAALFDPAGFSSTAERAIFWTRQQLDVPIPITPTRNDDGNFLLNYLVPSKLGIICSSTAVLAVHSMNTCSRRHP